MSRHEIHLRPRDIMDDAANIRALWRELAL